ncbi:MAG: class I SAM-dependent methyltransferase [Acidobacteria bacterium]|nr:class I SAM-dependent methyltransferase [Acidobacteriota bacterium]
MKVEPRIEAGYRWLEQRCPICNVTPTRFLGYRGGAAHRQSIGVECEIWSCCECGLIFPNPMPHPVGGLAQHYDADPSDYFVNHESPVKLLVANKLLERAEQWLGKKGKILDIGCGRGEIVQTAETAGWEVVGIEPSEPFADYAERHSGVKILRKTLEECHFDADEFDCIFLSAVLEHLYNPMEIVGEISRILKPGGLFYFDVPNESGLYFVLGNLYYRILGRKWTVNLAPTFSPYHLFGFNRRSLTRLLERNGLRIKELKICGGTSFVPETEGFNGKFESFAAGIVTEVSKFGSMGTYIEGWAGKS